MVSDRTRRVLLAVAPWPLVRALANPTFRRLYGRRRTVKSGAYLALYSLAFAVAVVRRPRIARLFAIVAGLGTAAELWVERSSSGRRSGLPPGKLPLIPVASVTDRDFLLKQLERNGPIAKASWLWKASPVVCVRGLRRGATVLREHSADVCWVGNSFDSLIPAGFIRSMSPVDHARYKPIFRQAFAEEAVGECTPHFREVARAAVAELASDAARDPGRPVDPRPMLGRITVRSYARLFFGVQPDTGDCDLVESALLEPGPLYALPGPWDRRFGELREAAATLAAMVRAKSVDLDDPSVARSFLGRLVRADPSAVDDPNVLLNLVFLFATGSRDVTGLLQWIVKLLGENPVWITSVRSSNGDLDRRIVMETLRLAQSEYITRRVLRSFEVDGYRVPKDWWLRVCVNESHRDPAVFASPETFDPDRFAGRRYTTVEYAPFGMFEHACLGVPATHALAGAFVREYCDLDWTVCEDGDPEYDGFHWMPSRRLRVKRARSLDEREDAV